MRPALGYPWDLHIRNSRAYIYRREDRQPIAALTPAEAVLLGLMDGTRSWAELRDIFVQAVGAPGLEVARSVESRLRPLLVDGYRRTCPYDLESLAQVHPPNPAEGLRPLPGPRVLHWWVTNYCPRRCIYCFARPILGGQPADATITRAELRKTFREAASLGTENLLVAGAEPFLRDDLPEVMGDALEAGITPLVTTKFPVSTSLAERLADAGIPHISLSVDTMDEDESLSLIGSREYPEQVRRSVQNLTRVGIAFSIQAVVTRMNPTSIRCVASFAASAGARMLEAVPFEPVAWPIGPFANDTLALEDNGFIDREVELLSQRFPSLKVQKFEELGSGSRAGYQCDIGMTKLFFLPNGVVHRCYKLTRDPRLQGRDLRNVPVAAAWHDPGFLGIISPPREAYAGSSCHHCARFGDCHRDGRCIYQAFIEHGRYEARDRACGGPY